MAADSAQVELSVITVTFERLPLLQRKLASLAAQTLASERFELVLCVNDDPATAQAVRAMKLPYALVLVIGESRLSASRARNACVARARGRLLYLSDDDAILAPDTLERHLAFHRGQGTPVAAVGAIDMEHEGAVVRARTLRVGAFSVNGVNTSLPAAAFAAAGGFPEWLEGYGFEDVLLGYALQRQGVRTVALPDAPVRHVGADPRWGLDPEKARMAGRNAVRAARRHPELAFALGVHPLSIASKRVALAPPLGALWRALSRSSFRYERAFLQGALEEIRHGKR